MNIYVDTGGRVAYLRCTTSAAADKRHLGRHDRHEQNVGV